MATITIHKWQCDRCRVVLDNEPARSPDSAVVTLSAGVHYATASGPRFNWKDLCDDCSPKVEAAIDKIAKDAIGDRVIT